MRKAPARCALMAKARGREPHVRVRVTQERVGEGPRAGPGVDDEAHQSPGPTAANPLRSRDTGEEQDSVGLDPI